MRSKTKIFRLSIAAVLLWHVLGHWGAAEPVKRVIVTSDSILAGMAGILLPPEKYGVEALLPPGQCPGHYDLKLSDIEKAEKADLVITFQGMPFMNKEGLAGRAGLIIDAKGRNWMAPDAYKKGLDVLAEKLSARFPEDRDYIATRQEEAKGRVETAARALITEIRKAGVWGGAVLASSMLKEPLEWMGFSIAGEYGRPESISAKEILRLSKIGKTRHILVVADNLQSGPEAGKGLAEAMEVPHVVLTNFPMEEGYLASLEANVRTILAAVGK